MFKDAKVEENIWIEDIFFASIGQREWSIREISRKLTHFKVGCFKLASKDGYLGLVRKYLATRWVMVSYEGIQWTRGLWNTPRKGISDRKIDLSSVFAAKDEIFRILFFFCFLEISYEKMVWNIGNPASNVDRTNWQFRKRGSAMKRDFTVSRRHLQSMRYAGLAKR